MWQRSAAEGYAENGLGRGCNRLCRFSVLGRSGLSVFSAADRIESGLLRSERRLLTSLKKTAIPTPSAKARATKYHRVGNPRTKIRALPTVKSRPTNPPPKESLCIVIPGCRFSVMERLFLSSSSHRSARGSRPGRGSAGLWYSVAVFRSGAKERQPG